MYELKKEVVLDINKTKASKDIGITRAYLTNVVNGKCSCSKVVAYCITKYINNNAEIEDYFERVN